MKKIFTFIELLVVIAILSILASLLLPALHRAKNMAYRASCMSNLRQAYTTIHIYADDFRGIVPLGSGAHYQSNYFFRYGGNLTPMAYMYLGGYIEFPEIFYCPTKPPGYAVGGFSYNTANNPWLTNTGTTVNVRSSYGGRPTISTIDNANNNGSIWFPDNGDIKRIDELHEVAILSDVTGRQFWISHTDNNGLDGVNRISGDGSASFVQYELFSSILEPIDNYGDTNNAAMMEIWNIMDEQ